MKKINGFDNEYEFVIKLNGMKVSELDPMFRKFIDELFLSPKENLLIKCWRNHLPQKTDIFIKIGGKLKGVSIKTGMKNSIHVEGINEFIHFLIINKVPRKQIIEYLKYHYADGSTNGKGNKRISIDNYRKNNQNYINELNALFNKKNILYKAIDRFAIKGKNSNYYIDAIIHGDVTDFIWILKSDVKKYILNNSFKSNAIHFGPFICQPKNRCLNYNPLYEKDRFCVQLKWYNLNDDIIKIMNEKFI